MGTIRQQFIASGDERIVKALNRIHREEVRLKELNQQVARQHRATAQAARLRAAEERKASAEAAKIAEKVQTPLEKYRVELAKVRDHVEAGRLSTEQLSRAKKELIRTLQQEEAALESNSEAAREAANADNKLAAEQRRAAQIMRENRNEAERLNDSIAELDRLKEAGVLKTRDYKRAHEQLTKELSELPRKVGQFNILFANLDRKFQSGKITVGQYNEEHRKLRGELERSKVAYDATGQAASRYRQLQATAAAAIERAITPTDRLTREIKELQAAKHAGLLTERQYAQEVRRLNTEFHKQQLAAKGAKKETLDMAGGVQRFTGRVIGAAAGATTLAFVLERIGRAAKDARERIADTAEEVDKMITSTAVQGALTREAATEETKVVLEVARRRGFDATQAEEVARQLVSSGFNDPVDDGSFERVIKTLQATNFQGDSRRLVEGVGQFITGFGLERDRASIDAVTGLIATAFRDQNIQTVDLATFAKNAKQLADSGFNMAEAIGTLADLRNILPAGESGTGARNFVQFIQELQKDGKKQDGILEQLNLTRDQIDFVDETPLEAAAVLRDALNAIEDRAKRTTLKTEIFGKENVSAASSILDRLDEIDDVVAGLVAPQAEQQFERLAELVRTSRQGLQHAMRADELLRSIGPAGDAAFTRQQAEAFFKREMEKRLEKIEADDTLSAGQRAAAIAQVKGAEFFFNPQLELFGNGIGDAAQKEFERQRKLNVRRAEIEDRRRQRNQDENNKRPDPRFVRPAVPAAPPNPDPELFTKPAEPSPLAPPTIESDSPDVNVTVNTGAAPAATTDPVTTGAVRDNTRTIEAAVNRTTTAVRDLIAIVSTEQKERIGAQDHARARHDQNAAASNAKRRLYRGRVPA